MYEWLTDVLDDRTCLVTANRRLGRELQGTWAKQQLASGTGAWRTPDIQPWQRWLGTLVSTTDAQGDVPTRINSYQSQLLWERCLRKELGESFTGIASVARQARDTWQRLADARLSIRDVAGAARSDDQRLFAAAAGRYQAVLEHEHWVDDAGLAGLALQLVADGRLTLQQRYVFAGFDRTSPMAGALQLALRERGSEVHVQEVTHKGATPRLYEFESRDAELRSAGAWARSALQDCPEAQLAIVIPNLEQSAARDGLLIREGFVPGWQYGPLSLRRAVNVSFGKRLSDYPAVSVALLALRWLVTDVGARDVARLLMTPLIGEGEANARSILELRMRDLPDRAWSPSMVTGALRGHQDAEEASDWITRLAAFSKRRRDLPHAATPAQWVLVIDDCLKALGWPGTASLGSDTYQLINRWRELLNDFARLDLVSKPMSARSAFAQLDGMAADTVFQPESKRASVQVLGPLEATGGEFDAIWISGATAGNWPPPGHPSPLLARALQVENEMPDATPQDTHAWASAMLRRLEASSTTVIYSYPLSEDDVEQTRSDLLGDIEAADSPEDPGWHAAGLADSVEVVADTDDAPPVANDRIYGGAGTIQNQMSEPFGAFARGRLGVRPLDRQATGIPALLRGNLVHDTLYRLYQGHPTAAELRSADSAVLNESIATAADAALQRHQRNADGVLLQLLQLERDRLVDIVTDFVAKDRERGDFRIASLEGELEFRHGNLRLLLRYDRLDRFDDGSTAILDYKTGSAKQLLRRDGTVKEVQLFVYAMASGEPVAMLALANIDSRETDFSGAGRGFTDESTWPDLLAGIAAEISAACDSLVAGDVRLIAEQGPASARRLNLLSRYTELRHEE